MLDRTEIRHKVIDLLKNHTSVGKNVYDSKITSYDAEELPAIAVFTPSQKGQSSASSQIPTFNSRVTINIEVTIAESENWSDKMDDICEEIETRLLKNVEFLNLFTQISAYSSDIGFKSGGEEPIVTAVISLEGTFGLTFNPVYQDDLKTISITHSLGKNNLNANVDFTKGDRNV